MKYTVGSKMPVFSLLNTEGGTFQLSASVGQRNMFVFYRGWW